MKLLKIIFLIFAMSLILLSGCKGKLKEPGQLEELGYGFSKDNILKEGRMPKVYFKGKKLMGARGFADPNSFEILSPFYVKDKDNVWYYNEAMKSYVLVVNTDSSSFHVLEEEHKAKDKYFNYTVTSKGLFTITVKEPPRYERINDYVFKDRYGVYYEGYAKGRGETITDLTEAMGIDPESTVAINYSTFFKDKSHVYHVVFYSLSSQVLRVEGADPDSFQVISQDFFKDNNSVFFYALGKYGDVSNLKDREDFDFDPSSFEILNENYARDKNNVYCYGAMSFRKLENVDPANIELINETFAKDKNNLYYCDMDGKATSWSDIMDPDSFQVINKYFFKDKNQIYCIAPYANDFIKIESADIPTFEIIDEDYDIQATQNHAKDKNHVYYCRQGFPIEIKNADPESFQILNSCYAKDKNSVYYYEIYTRSVKQIEGVDKNTFEVVNNEIAKDKNYRYKCPPYYMEGIIIEKIN